MKLWSLDSPRDLLLPTFTAMLMASLANALRRCTLGGTTSTCQAGRFQDLDQILDNCQREFGFD